MSEVLNKVLSFRVSEEVFNKLERDPELKDRIRKMIDYTVLNRERDPVGEYVNRHLDGKDSSDPVVWIFHLLANME